MPLPTLKKTWQFAHYVGTPSGGQNLDQANAFVAAKNHMKSFGSSPWTVVGSSDGTTGGLDAVDRWTSGAVIAPGTPSNPWIVLRQTGWNGGGEVCWQWRANGTIWMFSSPLGGFTGGSGSTRPTAPDEQNISANGAISSPYLVSGVFTIHTMMSTDGQCTRFFLGANNAYGNSYCWETIDTPTGNINNPVFSSSIVWGAFPDFRDLPLCMTGNAGQALDNANTLVLLTESAGQNQYQINLFNGANEISGEFPFYDFCIGVEANRGAAISPRGMYGRIFDMWFTSGVPAMGDGFPNDGSKQFICFHINQNFLESNVVVPWDGTTLVMG